MRALGGSGLCLALALCACASAIKQQVVTPPPSAPRAQFFIEAPEVQSRAVGDEAWRGNDRLGQQLAYELRQALEAKGRPQVTDATAPTIRSRVYVAHGAAAATTERPRRRADYIEVRLELIEDRQVRYSTLTRAELKPAPFAGTFGWGEDAQALMEQALRQAAQDFVSRL